MAMMLLSMGVVSETDITGTSQIVKFLFHYYFTILKGLPTAFQKRETLVDFAPVADAEELDDHHLVFHETKHVIGSVRQRSRPCTYQLCSCWKVSERP